MDHTSSPRSRLTIDLDPALRRRIKVAAIQFGPPTSDFGTPSARIYPGSVGLERLAPLANSRQR
jgi:hypothetical protein